MDKFPFFVESIAIFSELLGFGLAVINHEVVFRDCQIVCGGGRPTSRGECEQYQRRAAQRVNENAGLGH